MPDGIDMVLRGLRSSSQRTSPVIPPVDQPPIRRPSYGFQWQRCDAAGGNCQDIGAGARSTSVQTSTDVGTRGGALAPC